MTPEEQNKLFLNWTLGTFALGLLLGVLIGALMMNLYLR